MWLAGGLLFASMLTHGANLAMGQGAVASRPEASIERETRAIRAAESKALAQAKLGAMWGVLGSYYQDANEYEQAERAYTSALHLLGRSPESMKAYATVLDDLGSLYLETARLEAAENARRNALSVRRNLGDARAVAVSQGHLAEVELARHHFEDAARDAQAASDGLAVVNDQDASDHIAALVTLSYALCSEKRCGEGLEAARQALKQARAAFDADAAPVGHVQMAVGLAQWRMRANEEAEQSMREGLRVLKLRIAAGSPVLMSAMMEYRGLLKSRRRDNDIAALDAEIASMRRAIPAACADCTVSAYGLMHAAK